ncbi:btb domain transcription factor [Holotrichia oblita]|uniref:Btb domain transcription factor n=2 Tax=Holotrichia oblita TaxID=644536 RepID=A0ACB9SMV0_HOLOL|nr:btb domain transcription factor [Holotrichia oblita]KAI4456109.1 btb domain transcription factor [Holotrichia oblita]
MLSKSRVFCSEVTLVMRVYFIFIVSGSTPDTDLRTVHLHHLHVGKLALGSHHVQNLGDCERHIDWRVGFHLNCTLSGKIFSYCEPLKEATGEE